jgi:transcriptional regulator with XRE-family HTH domain
MLGQNIKKARAKRGWTQEQLAKKSGVGRPSIARYETENFTDIPMGTLISIAKALKVPALSLMKGGK